MAKGYYSDGFLRLDQDIAISQLDSWGLFGVSNIAAILHTTQYEVFGRVRHGKGIRGTLNPQHIDYLMYMLDGIVRPHWLNIMLEGGTTLNTIERLTGISRTVLNRKKWDGTSRNLQ